MKTKHWARIILPLIVILHISCVDSAQKLIRALSDNDVEAAAKLLEGTLDLSAIDDDGKTLLFLAGENLDLIMLLLEAGYEPIQSERVDLNKRFLELNHSALFREAGALAPFVDIDTGALAEVLIELPSIDRLQFLIEVAETADILLPADRPFFSDPLLVRLITDKLTDPAIHMIESGSDPLLQNGANTNAVDAALFTGNGEVFAALVASGVQIDISRYGKWIPAVASTGNRELFDFLIEAGADPDQEDQFGRSTIMMAVASGDAEFLNYVVELGLSIPVSESAYRPYISGIQASSHLISEGDNRRYAPARAFDNDPSTAWVEGRDDEGSGEWLTIGFHQPFDLIGLIIEPGLFNPEFWRENNRVKTLLVSWGGVFDKGSSTFTFADQMEPQFALLNMNHLLGIRLEIQTVYPGSVWNDTAISGISFLDMTGNYRLSPKDLPGEIDLPSDGNWKIAYSEGPHTTTYYLFGGGSAEIHAEFNMESNEKTISFASWRFIKESSLIELSGANGYSETIQMAAARTAKFSGDGPFDAFIVEIRQTDYKGAR